MNGSSGGSSANSLAAVQHANGVVANNANSYNHNYNYGLYGVNLVGGVGNLVSNSNLINNGLYQHHLNDEVDLLHHHAVNMNNNLNQINSLNNGIPMQIDEGQVSFGFFPI